MTRTSRLIAFLFLPQEVWMFRVLPVMTLVIALASIGLPLWVTQVQRARVREVTATLEERTRELAFSTDMLTQCTMQLIQMQREDAPHMPMHGVGGTF